MNNEQIEKLFLLINDLNTKVEFINNKITQIEKYIYSNNVKTNNFIELKKKLFELPKDFVLKQLHFKNINGDIEILKRVYLSTNNIPIKCIRRNHFKFFQNNMWNDDVNGLMITDIISNNLARVYRKHNKFNGDNEQFLSCQKHINKFKNDNKYCKQLFNGFIALVKEKSKK